MINFQGLSNEARLMFLEGCRVETSGQGRCQKTGHQLSEVLCRKFLGHGSSFVMAVVLCLIHCLCVRESCELYTISRVKGELSPWMHLVRSSAPSSGLREMNGLPLISRYTSSHLFSGIRRVKGYSYHDRDNSRRHLFLWLCRVLKS